MNNKIIIFVLALLVIPLDSATTIELEVQEQVDKSDTFEVNILAQDLEEAIGFEATLSFEGIEFVSIESETFASVEGSEELKVIGFASDMVNANGNQTLGTITFKANDKGVTTITSDKFTLAYVDEEYNTYETEYIHRIAA